MCFLIYGYFFEQKVEKKQRTKNKKKLDSLWNTTFLLRNKLSSFLTNLSLSRYIYIITNSLFKASKLIFLCQKFHGRASTFSRQSSRNLNFFNFLVLLLLHPFSFTFCFLYSLIWFFMFIIGSYSAREL